MQKPDTILLAVGWREGKKSCQYSQEVMIRTTIIPELWAASQRHVNTNSNDKLSAVSSEFSRKIKYLTNLPPKCLSNPAAPHFCLTHTAALLQAAPAVRNNSYNFPICLPPLPSPSKSSWLPLPDLDFPWLFSLGHLPSEKSRAASKHVWLLLTEHHYVPSAVLVLPMYYSL